MTAIAIVGWGQALANPALRCSDAFAGYPESIVGLAGGASCETLVAGRGWMCDVHAAASAYVLDVLISDIEPAERKASGKAGPVDPEARARRDAARAFVASYAGSNPFVLDIKSRHDRAPAQLRLTPAMVDALLNARDREAAQAAEAVVPDRLDEAVAWLRAATGPGTTIHNEFAESVLAGYQRFGRLTERQLEAVLRSVDRDATAAVPQEAAGRPKAAATAEGYYRDGETVYKVQLAVHGSGRPYAKRLVVTAPGEASWEYAPGMVRSLTEDMRLTLDEAVAFGRL